MSESLHERNRIFELACQPDCKDCRIESLEAELTKREQWNKPDCCVENEDKLQAIAALPDKWRTGRNTQNVQGVDVTFSNRYDGDYCADELEALLEDTELKGDIKEGEAQEVT